MYEGVYNLENLTLKLEQDIKSFVSSSVFMQNEAVDLEKLYWSEVSPDSTFSSATSGDAITNSTKLTKQEVINALTIAAQVKNFYQNSTLTQSDYYQNIQGIVYGNDQKTPQISDAIEAFGDRSVEFCNNILTMIKQAADILDLYFDTEISSAVGSISTSTVVFGSNVTKQELTDGINLCDNFRKMITNQVATQSDWGAIVAKWQRI